jgi:hypothetical protein
VENPSWSTEKRFTVSALVIICRLREAGFLTKHAFVEAFDSK